MLNERSPPSFHPFVGHDPTGMTGTPIGSIDGSIMSMHPPFSPASIPPPGSTFSDIKISWLRHVPTPSLLNLAEKYQSLTPFHNRVSTPVEPTPNPSPSWVIGILLGNDDPKTCYKQEDKVAKDFFTDSGRDRSSLRLDRMTCKRLCDEHFQKVNNWLPILPQERWLKISGKRSDLRSMKRA
jgi:hypothetical protein